MKVITEKRLRELLNIGYRIDMAGRDVRQARNILERVDALEDTKD